jgi:hypothetical protein
LSFEKILPEKSFLTRLFQLFGKNPLYMEVRLRRREAEKNRGRRLFFPGGEESVPSRTWLLQQKVPRFNPVLDPIEAVTPNRPVEPA